MNRNSSGRRYDREFKNNAVALVRGGRIITGDFSVNAFHFPPISAVVFGPIARRGSRSLAVAAKA
jgi:hypothetical protein